MLFLRFSGGRAAPVRFSTRFRVTALAVLLAFLAACTQTVPRGKLETRTFRVDWDKLDSRRLLVNGLVVDSVVLTPAQWPLEASLKRLFQLDFLGVISDFDLTFRTGNLRSDVLEKLFGEGFLPAYVRVTNRETQPVSFLPHQFGVRADRKTFFFSVPPHELPERFEEIDWIKTGSGVVMAALFVVVAVLAAKEGKGHSGGRMTAGVSDLLVGGADVAVRGAVAAGAGKGDRPMEVAPRISEKGLLQGGLLGPGETREGFLFFRILTTVPDWRDVKLEKL